MKLLAPNTSDRFLVAAERSRAVSESLRQLARVSRFSSASTRPRGRSGISVGARLDMLIWVLAFLVPTAIGAAYYGLILAPRYVTNLQLTVRGAEVLPTSVGSSGSGNGRSGADARMPNVSALDTAQNTLILVDYVEGRAMIEDLELLIPLRQIYASPAADRFSRLDPAEPIEEFQKYLKKYVTITVSMQSFALEIKVRAFTPEDSLKVAQAVQSACESMINKLYERSREKAVREAEDELRSAEATLSGLTAKMRELRNAEGMVDPEAAAKQGMAVMLGLEKQKAGVEVRIRSLQGILSADAPTMRQLRDERAQLDASIAEQRRAMASNDKTEAMLSASMQKFDTLKVQRQAAENTYVDMLKNFQLARIQAERQQVFLNTIVPPALPESAMEPYRLWWIGIVAGCAFVAAVLLSGLRRFLST